MKRFACWRRIRLTSPQCCWSGSCMNWRRGPPMPWRPTVHLSGVAWPMRRCGRGSGAAVATWATSSPPKTHFGAPARAVRSTSGWPVITSVALRPRWQATRPCSMSSHCVPTCGWPWPIARSRQAKANPAGATTRPGRRFPGVPGRVATRPRGTARQAPARSCWSTVSRGLGIASSRCASWRQRASGSPGSCCVVRRNCSVCLRPRRSPTKWWPRAQRRRRIVIASC